MLNNNNNNNNNIDDMILNNYKQQQQHFDQQQLSPIYNDSMYVANKCDDDRFTLESIDDYFSTTPSSPIDSIFSPTIKSPLGFASTSGGTTEESFTFETLPNGHLLPIKYSQEHDEGLSFTEEIDTVAQSTEFDQNYPSTSSPPLIKQEEEDDETNLNSPSMDNEKILYHDYMITGCAPIAFNNQQETQIKTVEHYSDILIKNENDKNVTQSSSSCNENCTNSNDRKELNNNFNFLTPSPSPHHHHHYRSSNKEINLHLESSSKHIDHNYIVVPQENISTCKRKLVLEPITNTTDNNAINMKDRRDIRINRKRISGKRPIIPKIQLPVKLVRQQSIGGLEITTPEITADILKMEDENFDLIKYLTSAQVKIVILHTKIFIELKKEKF